MDDIDLLVVMGGPQAPSTTKQECTHFDASAECLVVNRRIRELAPVPCPVPHLVEEPGNDLLPFVFAEEIKDSTTV